MSAGGDGGSLLGLAGERPSARLAAHNISFAYRRRDVLRDVSLGVGGGEVVGVLGPNGSGKTTLLRCLLGYATPRAGRITLDGRDLSLIPRRSFARRVAAVPQEMPTDFPLRVGELALLGRLPHLPASGLGFERPADLAAAEAALAACGVAALADRPLHELSGGELRRAFIARALAQLDADGPATVLLLDEPTSGLDLRHQAAIVELLRERAAAGTAVLLVLHDVNLAAAVCDRVALMKDGELVAEGPPARVLTVDTLTSVYDVALEELAAPGDSRRLFVHARAAREGRARRPD